ncbi:MAG: hypothetical protein U1F83_20185 [Verrucomicrobiota bacterium]
MKINLKQFEVWFVTGSQHLYGPETLKAVAKHSQEIAKTLNAAATIPVKIVFKPVMVSPDAITEHQQANNARNCIGLITWRGIIRFRRRRCGSTASSNSASRSATCTRNTIATSRGARLTWTS